MNHWDEVHGHVLGTDVLGNCAKLSEPASTGGYLARVGYWTEASAGRNHGSGTGYGTPLFSCRERADSEAGQWGRACKKKEKVDQLHGC